MNKRGAGIILIAISAFLMSVKYVSAAMLGSGLGWNDYSLDDEEV